MLSRVNGVFWMDEEREEDDAVSWSRGADDGKDESIGLPSFKSLLDEDWYVHTTSTTTPVSHQDDEIKKLAGFVPTSNLPDHPTTALLDSSSSCSPSSIFTHDPSSFLPQMPCLSSLLSSVCANPFDSGLDLGSDAAGFLTSLPPNPNFEAVDHLTGAGFGALSSQNQTGASNFSLPGKLTRVLPLCENMRFGGLNFDVNGSLDVGGFLNRPKVLRPLEIFPPAGAQPTLFQKRAALWKNLAAGLAVTARPILQDERGKSNEDEVDDASVDGSGLLYDSDDAADDKPEEEATADAGGLRGGSNLSSGVAFGSTADQKGKKKGLPAKNLMAERRRRKKLNDRLYMLRSVVPKISKVSLSLSLYDRIGD